MTLAATFASDPHVNIPGASAILGCTRHLVLSYTARGLLHPVALAGRVFFARSEVEALRDRLAAEQERLRPPRRRLRAAARR